MSQGVYHTPNSIRDYFKGGFPLVRIWSRDPCDRSKAVARTSRTTARPMAWACLLSNYCRIKAIWLALFMLVAEKLKSIQLPKSVARSPKTGESSSVKRTTQAQTIGRAIVLPNSHKWKPALNDRISEIYYGFSLKIKRILPKMYGIFRDWYNDEISWKPEVCF